MAANRHIRVFVSSTFRDMQAERDLLVKRVFPQLRNLCAERAVAWTEVDLRWGITDEQAAEGQVLPLCLAEIERCRPYFIGVLGERYGWVPDQLDEDLLADQPWLAEHRQRSVTDLEIVHGVLRDPAMADRSLFYFRDPAYVETLPGERRGEMLDGEEPYEPDGDGRAGVRKIDALKDRIRAAHRAGCLKYAPREGYAAPEAFAEQVLADFTAILDELYPADQVPDPLDQEAARHDAYARSRRVGFISRAEHLAWLDAHMAGDGPPAAIIGESGGGKSALLAEWTARWRQKNPNDLVIEHYIGSTPGSADWRQLVVRLLGEFKRRYEITDDIPAQPEKLRSALLDWQVKTAGQGRIVLVLDALNQLTDAEAARELGWLPRVFPPNTRVVVSCLAGPVLERLRERRWTEHELSLFGPEEVDGAAAAYLGLYGKTLPAAIQARLQRTPAAANPLYLRAFLDELRQFGRHEKLAEWADSYLACGDLPALYGRILDRWSEDFGASLVREAFCLIAAARYGLSDAELLDLLGHDGQPLPRRQWTPLYLAAEGSLSLKAGLLTFGHDYLRQAVTRRWLADPDAMCATHVRLADYFEGQPGWPDRKLAELPWQLAEARGRSRLHALLTDLDAFVRLCARNRHELLAYWLGLGTEYDLANDYAAAWERWSAGQPDETKVTVVAGWLGLFFYSAGRYVAAEPLYRRALEASKRRLGDAHAQTLAIVNNLAILYRDKGDYAAAEPLYRRAMTACEEAFGPEHAQTLASVNNLALLLYSNGDFAAAEPLYRRALEACERILGPEHPQTLDCLNNLALLLYAIGEYSIAEPLYRRALDACERILGPEHPDTLSGMCNMALLLDSKGDYAASEPLHRRALEARERVLGPEHPHTLASVNNLAVLLDSKCDYAAAEPLYRRALEACERVLGQEHPQTQDCLNNLAVLLYSNGDYASAEPLLRRVLEARERVLGPEHPDTLASVNNLAGLFQQKGDCAAAEPLYRRAFEGLLRISLGTGRSHPNLMGVVRNYISCLKHVGHDEQGVERILAAILGQHGMPQASTSSPPPDPTTDAQKAPTDQAKAARQAGRYAEAASAHRQALAECERTLGPEHPDTLASLNNLAWALFKSGGYAESEPLYRRALEVRERTLGPEHPDTLASANGLAELLHARGDYAAAELLFRRALEARERTLGPEHPDAFASLDGLAMLLRSKGEHDEAKPLLEQALAGRERVLGPDHPDTLASVNNMAELHFSMGEDSQVQRLLERAFDGRQHTLGPEHPDTLMSLNNLGVWLQSCGDFAGAQRLHEQALALRQRILGLEHPDTLGSLNDLGVCRLRKREFAEAEALLRRAVEGYRRVLGPNHSDTKHAEDCLRDVFSACGKAATPPPSDVAGVYNELVEQAKAAREAVNLPLAIENYRRALEILDKTFGPDDEMPRNLAALLAGLLEKVNDYSAALAMRRRVLESYERSIGPDKMVTLAAAYRLAAVLQHQGLLSEAEQHYRRVLSGLTKTARPNDRNAANVREALLRLAIDINNAAIDARKAGQLDEAETLMRQAIGIEVDLRRPDDPKIPHRLNNLAVILLVAGKLPDAMNENLRAWKLKAGKHDLTSGRILFVRAALAMLLGRPVEQYFGQLKTLLAKPDLPCLGNIDPIWHPEDCVNHLGAKLSAGQAGLLAKLAEVLNDHAVLPALDAHPAWAGQPAVPLDVPWPAEPAPG